VVSRPRLIERLNEGLHHNLTFISAPAGFGKTTLVSAWIEGIERPTAWLSLDEGENDPIRFLTYLVAAVQTIAATFGAGVLRALQSPQPPPPEALLVALLNDLTTIKDPFVLVLDDYHVIDTQPVDQALTYLVEHMPLQMHLVITTREDPPLPLARLRARGQLTEVRATDLRFTPAEAAAFLTQVMGLTLSAADIAALEQRTEGWIAGLQFAALSLQGLPDATSFIRSFTGSHQYVVDYLLEEVLGQQPVHIQTFLLRTSILDRLCGPLCDAVLLDAPASGQATLEYLERANLFIVPLDSERRWYRYHHLFADLLRLRLSRSLASPGEEASKSLAELHIRASQWYEDHDLELEAFRYAAAAHDVERTERLIEGEGMPLYFQGGAVALVLHWLKSLPKTVLDAWPSLWTAYAATLLATGQVTGVEEKLQAAEAALEGTEPDDITQDLVGRIAAIRATAATSQNQVETIIAQSRRALEYLHPNNLAFRTSTAWKLGYAYFLQGDRAAARQACTEVIALSQASGNTIFTFMATIGVGLLQEADNQLHLAAATYRHVLQQVGESPLPFVCEAYLGLARISYEWNNLEAAEQHAQRSVHLARQLENTERFVACEVLLARLQLAQGDVTSAVARLSEAAQSARQHNFENRIPEVAAVQVLTLLRQGHLAAAAHLAQAHELPLSQARVSLAQGDTSAALTMLELWREQVEAKGWQDERLQVLVLQAVALDAHGELDRAVHLLCDALSLAEPGGFIRLFVDEGRPMARLLSQAAALGKMPDYLGKLLVACQAEEQKREDPASRLPVQPLIELLSPRELEVLQLMAQGRSNQEISERLFLALSTVKGHNRNIFDKLQVQRRTEAVARARELGLL
jgi:LuxR family maltose regulon positive regulatory protein